MGGADASRRGTQIRRRIGIERPEFLSKRTNVGNVWQAPPGAAARSWPTREVGWTVVPLCSNDASWGKVQWHTGRFTSRGSGSIFDTETRMGSQSSCAAKRRTDAHFGVEPGSTRGDVRHKCHEIWQDTKTAMVYVLVVMSVVPNVAGAALLSFQLLRTCHGKHCLDRYQVAKGTYQIPGMACFRPTSFYSPGQYEKYPRLAREYFSILYLYVVGDALVVYLRDRDRYIVIWHHYGRSPDLDRIEAEGSCATDVKFKINENEE